MRFGAARAYEKASEKALNMVETEMRAGQVAISVVLTSQQNYQQARLSVIQARALLFADVAASSRALEVAGGQAIRPTCLPPRNGGGQSTCAVRICTEHAYSLR